jgi:hypothetical protein
VELRDNVGDGVCGPPGGLGVQVLRYRRWGVAARRSSRFASPWYPTISGCSCRADRSVPNNPSCRCSPSTSQGTPKPFGFAAVIRDRAAVHQFRFRWIWPLILVHALADFTTVLAAEPLPDLLVGVSHILLLAFGIILLRGFPDSSVRSSPAPAAVPR